LYVPVPHRKHAVNPFPAVYDPASHMVHASAADVWPVPVPKVPGEQVVHTDAPAADQDPAWHSAVQGAANANTLDNLPASQSVHEVMLTPPVTVPYLPLGHCVHDETPVEGVYVPCTH